MNNSIKRRKQRITALMLIATLLMGGCSNGKKNDRFELTENKDNEIVAIDDSYIDNEYINKYYVLEVYNRVSKQYELYIVRFDGYRVGEIGNYTDVFSNLEFSVGYYDSLFDCIKITGLDGYLVSLGLNQLKYSYEDMKNIYEVIKENYVFEDDSSLSRRRVINNRI